MRGVEGLPPRVSHTYKTIGDCPKCGAPGASYEYVVEGPIDDERENARVKAIIECPICGYRETRAIVFPVKALYLIRMMLVPELRPAVEKLYLLYKIRVLGEATEAGES